MIWTVRLKDKKTHLTQTNIEYQHAIR